MTTKHTPSRNLLLAIAREAFIKAGEPASFADGVIENVTGDFRDTLDYRDEAAKIINNISAPDLLAALERIANRSAPCMSLQSEKEFERNSEANKYRTALSMMIIELRTMARAAIAKAKGE